MTYAEELVLVQNAISNVLQTGQAYGIEGRNLTRANLNELYARESFLQHAIARSSSGGVMYGVPYG